MDDSKKVILTTERKGMFGGLPTPQLGNEDEAVGIIGHVGLGRSTNFDAQIAALKESGRPMIIIDGRSVVFNNTEISDEEALAKALNSIERPSPPLLELKFEMLPQPQEIYFPQKSDNQPWAKRGKHCKGNNYRKR